MTAIATFSTLVEREPRAARAAGLDLIVVRLGDEVRVLYGRCPHRGASMADACCAGDDLICKAHGWDFRVDTGESAHVDGERLQRFHATIDHARDAVCIDELELAAWRRANPAPFDDGELL